LAVLGTGSVLPGAAISTVALLAEAGRYLPEGAPALAMRIAKRLNIAQRHMVRSFSAALEVARPYDSGPKLGSRAITLAVEQAQLDISAIRLLLGHTTTPHTLLPAMLLGSRKNWDSAALTWSFDKPAPDLPERSS